MFYVIHFNTEMSHMEYLVKMFIFTYVGFFATSTCVLNFLIMCTCTRAPNIWADV